MFEKGHKPWNAGLKGYTGGLVHFSEGHVPWNKGLTKETSPLQARAAANMKGKHTKEDTGVGGKHDRIRRANGRERVCENCGTTDAKLYDWANLDHKYNSEDPDVWMRLCRGCHARYDFGKIPLKGLYITERGATVKDVIKYLVPAKTGDDNLAKRPEVRAKISASLKGNQNPKK